MAEYQDITETGPVGLRGMRALSADEEEFLNQSSQALPTLRYNAWVGNTGSLVSPAVSEPQHRAVDDPLASWGSSKYDTMVSGMQSDADALNESRYNNQSTLDAMGNAIVKMLGTAATTLVSSIAGPIVGIPTAIREGRWSGLWDNELTQALSDFDEQLEDNFKIYQSKEQQNAPWLSAANLTSASFWGDDVIRNAGFMLGAAASGSMFTGALGLAGRGLGMVGKAMNLISDVDKAHKIGKFGQAMLGSVFSAAGEGAIEAKNLYNDTVELETQRLDDEIGKLNQAAVEEYERTKGTFVQGADGSYYDPAYQKLLNTQADLRNKRETALQQIQERARSAGNWDMLFNMPILVGSNMITLGKGFSKSYRNAAKMAEAETRATGADFIKGTRNIKGKAKEAFTQARKSPTEKIKDAINYSVKGTKHKALRTVGAAVKPFVAEGSEEMNQAWASATAGDWKMADDVSEYWEAKKDNSFGQEALSFATAIGQGFLESWGSFDQWEQLFVGGLTGAVGMPMPTKVFGRSERDNQKKKYNPSRYFSWEGGSFSSIKEFKDKLNSATEATENLNNRMKNPDFWNRLESMTAHAKYQEDMENSVANESIKDYKDAEEKQFVQDLEAFVKAGKVDDFRTLINAATQDLSDADITDLINRQRIVVSAEKDAENKRNKIREQITDIDRRLNEGNLNQSENLALNSQRTQLEQQLNTVVGEEQVISPYMDSHGNMTKSIEEIKAELQQNGEALNKRVDNYLNSISYVNRITRGNLSSDQEGALAYLHYMGNQANERANKIVEKSNILTALPNIPIKTTKTTEELNKEIGVSDNTIFRTNPESNEIEIIPTSIEDPSKLRYVLQAYAFNRDNFENSTKLLEESPYYNALSQEDKDNIIRDLGDIIKLGYDASRFYTTLQEYMNNPERVDEKKARAEEKNDKEINNSNIDNKSTSELAKGMENGEINMDDIPDFDDSELSALEDNETSDEEKADIERRQKLNTAKSIVDTKRRINRKLEDLVDNDAELNDIFSLLDNSSDTANSVEDLLDTNSEAFNDPEALPVNNEEQQMLQAMQEEGNTPEELEEALRLSKQARLDNIKNIIEEAKATLDEEDTELSKLPKRDDTTKPEIVFKRGKGKDPVDTTDPVNSEKPKEDTKREEVDNSEDIQTPYISDTSILGNTPQNPNNPSDTKGYWKSNTTEYSIKRDMNGNKPYHEYVSDPKKKALYSTIHAFLQDKGVFARLNNNEVKPGDKVRFALSKKLSRDIQKATGEVVPVLLVIDDNGNIISDMANPKDANIFNNFEGLRDLYAKAIQYFNEHNNDNTDDLVIIPNVSSTVAKMYVGRPLYTPNGNNMEHTLNTIADGRSFKLSIALTASPNATMVMEPGRKKAQGLTKEERSIMSPSNAETGQPYLLIETSDPRRRWFPVQICMPTFNSNDVPAIKGSKLYRAIVEHFMQLNDLYNSATPSNKMNAKGLREWKDKLKDLLAISDVYVEVKNVMTPQGAQKNLIFRVKRRKSDTAWETINNSPMQLSGANIIANLETLNIPFQISRKYINGEYNGQPYNEMIGELAFTNIEIGALHTVNDFFTINPIVNNKEKRAIGPKGLDEMELDYRKQVGISNVPTSVKTIKVGPKEYEETVEDKPIKILDLNKGDRFIINYKGSDSFNVDSSESFYKQEWEVEDKGPFSEHPEISMLIKNKNGELRAIGSGSDGLELDIFNTNPLVYRIVNNPPSTTEAAPKPSREEILNNINSTKLFNSADRQAILERLPDDILSEISKIKKIILKNRANDFFNKVKSNMTDDQLSELAKKSFGIRQNREYTPIERQVPNREAIIKKELRVIRKLLPQLDEGSRTKIVDTIIKIPNGEAWGQFKDGIITIYRNAAEGTTYHEAFHFVFNSLMSDNEIESAYNNARRQWGNLEAVELEERMAEDFRRYMQNRESSNLFKRLWIRLKNLISNIVGNTNYLDRIYSDIAKGNFANRIVSDSAAIRNSEAYTIESLQERVNNYVNRANSSRISRNKAWGDIQDSLNREGYKMKGHYDKTYGWRVDSIVPKDNYRTSNEIRQYHYNKLGFNRLNQEQKDYLNERNISESDYNNMTLLEREVLFRCMY